MDWKPSNEPGRLDRARAARADPIARELARLRLPLIRQRKLNGILNALMMQIEDGGDSPEVNRLLLDALREGLRHQVGEAQARAVLRAIDAFEEAEAERWVQVRAGTLPVLAENAHPFARPIAQDDNPFGIFGLTSRSLGG